MIENNNKETNFIQVWPDYVYTDVISEELPELGEPELHQNSDGSHYTIQKAKKKDLSTNEEREYLMHISNFLLTKEFRQKNLFKFDNEELLRRIILPGQTSYRNYTPSFNVDGTHAEYSAIDPQYDFENCRIKLNTKGDKVYINCWIYIGETLLEAFKPPFSDSLYLLINLDSNAKGRIKLLNEEDKDYFLPKSDMTGLVEKNATIVTHETLNTVINEIGVVDGGRWW